MYLPINKYDILLTLIFMQKNVEGIQISVVMEHANSTEAHQLTFSSYTQGIRGKERKKSEFYMLNISDFLLTKKLI